MIVSIWRYSHLAFALISALFVLLLALTGIILAFDPISNRLTDNVSVEQHAEFSVAQVKTILERRYLEVLEFSVDPNDFLQVSVITQDGDVQDFYVDPATGIKTGDIIEQSSLMKFATNLHRSLFLKSVGRVFVGINSFLLFLIVITGIILIAKRQLGVKNFFKRIIKEGFNQYSHIALGRFTMGPLLIICMTGVYLSLLRFSIIPSVQLEHNYDFQVEDDDMEILTEEFLLFSEISITELRKLEYPFSDDPTDYYVLSIQDKEMLVHQYTGAKVSELSYPLIMAMSDWSTILHTGRGTILWSLILALSCLAIPYFMYSGFQMMLKKRASRIQNGFEKHECSHIILVGSETGTTMQYAQEFQVRLHSTGIKSYMEEMNNFTDYPNMEHLIVFTSTYGQGEAPTNANKFEKLIKSAQITRQFNFSVVGFGSLAYPDFCRFAFDVDGWINTINESTRLMAPFSINKRSNKAFLQWFERWKYITGTDADWAKLDMHAKSSRKRLTSFEIVGKDIIDDTFTLELKPQYKVKICSGDLLGVYPNEHDHERLYSVGFNNRGNLMLSIKRHDQGRCSNYLFGLKPGQRLEGQVVENDQFHFPKKAPQVILVANGTGIAPFIGMINQEDLRQEVHLYWGIKERSQLKLYEDQIINSLDKKRLTSFKIAYSREENGEYVQDLIFRDAGLVADVLSQGGAIMICGLVAMHKGVMTKLDQICIERLGEPLSAFESQVKSDCY